MCYDGTDKDCNLISICDGKSESACQCYNDGSCSQTYTVGRGTCNGYCAGTCPSGARCPAYSPPGNPPPAPPNCLINGRFQRKEYKRGRREEEIEIFFLRFVFFVLFPSISSSTSPTFLPPLNPPNPLSLPNAVLLQSGPQGPSVLL